MHTNPNQRAALWLAGWYTIPGEDVNFVSRRQPQPAPWPDAAAWLREQMHHEAAGWEPTECASLHVDSGQVMGNLVFPNCLEFIAWAVANRQGRGVWGRDADRCYYLIVADGGESGDRAQVNADVTPPLVARAPVPTTAVEDMAAVPQ